MAWNGLSVTRQNIHYTLYAFIRLVETTLSWSNYCLPNCFRNPYFLMSNNAINRWSGKVNNWIPSWYFLFISFFNCAIEVRVFKMDLLLFMIHTVKGENFIYLACRNRKKAPVILTLKSYNHKLWGDIHRSKLIKNNWKNSIKLLLSNSCFHFKVPSIIKKLNTQNV